MTTVGEFEIFPVCEKFSLFLLKSKFKDFNIKDWVASDVLFIGNEYESMFPKKSWINVQFDFTKHFGNNLENISLKRNFQIVCIPGLESEIIMSEDGLFNLLNSVYSQSDAVYVIPKCLVTFVESCDRPKKASEVHLCLLSNSIHIEADVSDVLFMNYFRYPRHLHKNDIFTIDILQYIPELKYTEGYSNLKTVHFQVCYVQGRDNSTVNNNLDNYLVDESVTVYQTSTRNSFITPQFFSTSSYSLLNSHKLRDYLRPLLPLYLQKYNKIMVDSFRPFFAFKIGDIHLKPFFLLSGPKGCGKTLLLESISKRLGLQYMPVECLNLVVGGSSFNEAKLKAIFCQIKKHLPCVVHFRNIEALCEDLEGNEDTHIINCLNKLISATNYNLPFFIIGTTSSIDKLSSELLQSVLQVIKIESLSKEERADVLSWICHIHPVLGLEIASRTSGFSLSDLNYLVNQVVREKSKNSLNDLDMRFEDFSGIIERMNADAASKLGAPQVPSVAWNDVGGHNEIKKEIVRSLSTANFGTGLKRSGILLWGPPGTGKTLLAKAVANECKSTFLSVKGPELLNKYVGQSEENVRLVFERAREAAPCIIFFDELDSLAPNRGKTDSAGVMDRVVSQLLSEMDGLQKNDGIFVLGATNRPDLIDPALLRPGRLDKMLYVGPCEGTEAKLSVLKAVTRKFEVNPDVDLLKIAELLPICVTGADIYSICYNAWQNAARNVIRKIQSGENKSEKKTKVVVTAHDFTSAIDNFSISS